MFRVWWCILSIGMTAAGLQAQSGVVKSGNQPIPGAIVTATQGATKTDVVTDQSGRYTLPPLAAGEWSIEVTMFGFAPVKKQVTDPEPSRQLDFNLTLKESEIAARMSRFAGGGGQNGNQIESQIQNEVSAGEAPQQAAPGAAGANDNFLISGSLSQGLQSGAAPDFALFRGGPGGGQDGQTPNAPGFGGQGGQGGGAPHTSAGGPGAGHGMGGQHAAGPAQALADVPARLSARSRA